MCERVGVLRVTSAQEQEVMFTNTGLLAAERPWLPKKPEKCPIRCPEQKTGSLVAALAWLIRVQTEPGYRLVAARQDQIRCSLHLGRQEHGVRHWQAQANDREIECDAS